ARFVRLEEASAFQHQVDTQVLVRQLAGIAFAGHGDIAAVNDDRVVPRGYFAGEATVNRIVGEEQRVGLGVGQVVDRDEFQIVIIALEDGTRDKPPDPSEPVDRYFSRHLKNSC